MHISTAAAAGLLTLCACLPSDSNAQPRGDAYRAHGTEPFWSLTLDGATMRFETPGGRPVVVREPRPIVGFAGEIYRTARLDVNIVHSACTDGMSDKQYRDTVQVTADGRHYQGCGGAEIAAPAPAPSPLAGEWRILSIAGRAPVRGAPATIRFERDRVNGNTGCNAFSGRYTIARGTLTAGPMITTKRACTRLTNDQERALLDLLGRKLSVREAPGGRRVLTAPGGRTLVLAR